MSLKKVHTKSEVHSSPLLLFRKPEFFPYILAHHHHHKQTRPKTTGPKLRCEKLCTSHDVKSFAIGSVLERFVVKIANDCLY